MKYNMNNSTYDTTIMPTYSTALPPGTELDHYRIIKELGRGGFGITYLAEENLSGRTVVIKENFPKDYACRDYTTNRVLPDGEDKRKAFEWAKESFLKEAQALNKLTKLTNPNIVTVLSVFEANGTVYFTMPYLAGKSLTGAYLTTRISEAELLPLLRTLLSALKHLHEHELVHRDIKPDNILLTDENIPVLIDFGAARQMEGTGRATQIGTPGYAPPEQMSTENYDKKPKPRIDLYALGATCYYLMTGNYPNDALSDWKECFTELKKRYSADLLKSIEKSLQRDPEKRWQTAAEWLAALTMKSEERKKGGRKGLVAAVAIIALGGVAYVASQHGKSDPLIGNTSPAVKVTDVPKVDDEAARKIAEAEAARKVAEAEAARLAAEAEAARLAREAVERGAKEEAARQAAELEARRVAELEARKAAEAEAARKAAAALTPEEKKAKAAAELGLAPGMVVKVWSHSGINQGELRPHNPEDFGAGTIINSSAPIRLEALIANRELAAGIPHTGNTNLYGIECSGYIYVPEDGEYALQVKGGKTMGSYAMKATLNDEELFRTYQNRYMGSHTHSGTAYLKAGFNPITIFMCAEERCNSGKFEIGLRKAGSLNFTPLTPADFSHQ